MWGVIEYISDLIIKAIKREIGEIKEQNTKKGDNCECKFN